MAHGSVFFCPATNQGSVCPERSLPPAPAPPQPYKKISGLKMDACCYLMHLFICFSPCFPLTFYVLSDKAASLH